MGEVRTRFAPSPTGQLHLGHVAAMLYVWGLAARCDAVVDVRIEDHDRQRCRPEYTTELREILDWLEFVPCRNGRWSVQSEQSARYKRALAQLQSQNLVYSCRCSRKELEAGSGSTGERRYPGHCRDRNFPITDDSALRVRLPDEEVQFFDGRLGRQKQRPAEQCGDLLIRDRAGNWTYQFAVVVDDWLDQINWIIRGDDLLPSTGRQLLLANLLGRTEPMTFFHHSLIVNADGVKLSKRDRAAPLTELQAQGLSAADIRGLAAQRCGLTSQSTPIMIGELRELFGTWPLENFWQSPFEF